MTDNTNSTDIPQGVIEALADVLESAEVNMFDRQGVMKVASDGGWHGAVIWLYDNKDRYIDALNAMGEFISNKVD